MCHASLGDFGLTFAYAHKFNQIGLGFAPPAHARVERASILIIFAHAWVSVYI